MAHSRTAPCQAVERAQILVAYADGAGIWAIHRTTGFSTRKVRRCVDWALAAGPQAALADRPRPGRPRQVTPADRAWIIGWACQNVFGQEGIPNLVKKIPRAGGEF